MIHLYSYYIFIHHENEKYHMHVYIYRGYYTAVRRYDFYLRVVKTIFYKRAQRVSKILFLTREDKSHIFKPPCNTNVLFII
jgi:hypothetical protein